MRRALAFAFLGLLLVMVALPAVIVKSCRYPDTPALDDGVVNAALVRVYVHTTGQIVTLPLEEYTAGVVAAEMPTSFGLEALKAQAVLARTFAVRNMRTAGGQGVPGQPGADVSTDIWAAGQAWLSQDDARREWGVVEFYGRWAKVEEAVSATVGLILTYQGVPIEASYHSTCGGATENSEDVWQAAVPYLRGVTDPWCAGSPWSSHETEIAVSTLEQAFGLDAGVLAAAAGQGRSYLQVLEETPSARAKRIRIGEREVDASVFRRALGLQSARFTYTLTPDVIRFVTSGYGHGVGLCQYGAEGMAQAGKDYRAILDFYFTGTELSLYRTGS